MYSLSELPYFTWKSTPMISPFLRGSFFSSRRQSSYFLRAFSAASAKLPSGGKEMPVLCWLAIYASSSCVRSRLGVGPSRSPSQGDVLTERVTPFPRGPQGAVELGWSVFARRL